MQGGWQPPGGGFGQPPGGGYGQPPGGGGYGQPPAGGSGGYGPPGAAPQPYGQPPAPGGGFPQPGGAPPGGQPGFAPPPHGGQPPGGGFAPPPLGGQPGGSPGFNPPPLGGQPGGASSFGPPPLGGAPAFGGASGQAGGAYEFGPADNATIEKTANRTTIWGYISIASGLAAFVAGAMAFSFAAVESKTPLVSGFIGMAVNVVIGATFIKAGKSLKMVVTTRGNDVQLMMNALQRLTSAFTIQIGVTILSILLTAAVTAYSMLAAMLGWGAPPG